MDIAPQDAPQRSTRKAGLIGGLIGFAGLAASVFALTATAGAATPTLTAQQDDAPASTEPPAVEQVEAIANDAVEEEDFEFPEEFKAVEQCVNDVFEKFDMDFDAMMSGADFSDTEAVILHEADWDALDAEAEKCNELLPAEIQAELALVEAAWDAHGTCVDDAFEAAGIELDIDQEYFDDAHAGNGFVSVFGGDEETFASFADGDATITITKVGDDIAVATDGDIDVETIDIAALEDFDGEAYELSAEEAELEELILDCDDQLPEGFDDIYVDEFDTAALENTALEN